MSETTTKSPAPPATEAAESDLLALFRCLPPADRRSLADYARALAVQSGIPLPKPRGTSGRDLEEFFGTLSPEAADAMERVIEEMFEQVPDA